MVEAELRVADFELRGVNPHGYAARTRREVVARQRALSPLIELPVGVERQGMRRNHHAAPQLFAPRFLPSHQNRPSRVSKCVGFASVGPPIPTQSATHSIICSIVTDGYPNRRWQRDALLSRAVSDSLPSTIGATPKRSPKRPASHRTAMVSGPVTLSTA